MNFKCIRLDPKYNIRKMQKGQGKVKQTSNQFIKLMKQLQGSDKWEQVDEKPVKLSRIQREGRIASKGEIVINVPFQALTKYYSDPLYLKKQSDKVIKAEVIHREDNLDVIKIIMQGIAIVSNREFIAVYTYHEEGNKVYVGNRSIDFPCQPQKDTVRAHANVSGNIIEKINQNSCKLTNISDLDMNGSIPDFVKKMIATKRVEALVQVEGKIKASQKL